LGVKKAKGQRARRQKQPINAATAAIAFKNNPNIGIIHLRLENHRASVYANLGLDQLTACLPLVKRRNDNSSYICTFAKMNTTVLPSKAY
jgi:hypothetical protein